MSDVERLISNPTLRPDEWSAFIKQAKIKKQDIARMIGIEPESLSRILKGKPVSVASEKIFRMIMVCELLRPEKNMVEADKRRRTVEQFGALTAICSLALSPMEVVQ